MISHIICSWMSLSTCKNGGPKNGFFKLHRKKEGLQNYFNFRVFDV